MFTRQQPLIKQQYNTHSKQSLHQSGLQQWKNRGAVFFGGPCQEVIIRKIHWTTFSSVCDEIAFLSDKETESSKESSF
jgi:hypothetical protein